MSERTVTITDDDVAFMDLALVHYGLFAEVAERQGEARTAGILRKQEFYAERFLLRLNLPRPSDRDSEEGTVQTVRRRR